MENLLVVILVSIQSSTIEENNASALGYLRRKCCLHRDIANLGSATHRKSDVYGRGNYSNGLTKAQAFKFVVARRTVHSKSGRQRKSPCQWPNFDPVGWTTAGGPVSRPSLHTMTEPQLFQKNYFVKKKKKSLKKRKSNLLFDNITFPGDKQTDVGPHPLSVTGHRCQGHFVTRSLKFHS